jgi:hypothetical protein
MSDKIYAYMTADAVYPDGREEHGWIDPEWSHTELFTAREDVDPIMEIDAGDEFLADAIREILGDGGAFEDNGDGTYYGSSSTQCQETGVYWGYAVHFIRESGDAEFPWHPVKDGGIELH